MIKKKFRLNFEFFLNFLYKNFVIKKNWKYLKKKKAGKKKPQKNGCYKILRKFFIGNSFIGFGNKF